MLDTNYIHGWYKKISLAATWVKMRKVVPIYAIDFATAKKNGVVDSENKIKSNGIYKEIDEKHMICRDEDYNIWTEKTKSFNLRYKITDDTQGIWNKYKPTKKAINLAKPRIDSDIVDMKSKNGKSSWQITKQELATHYVPVIDKH